MQFLNIRKVVKFPPKYSLRNRDGLCSFTSCLNIQELSTFKRFHKNLKCLTNSKLCSLKEEDIFLLNKLLNYFSNFLIFFLQPVWSKSLNLEYERLMWCKYLGIKKLDVWGQCFYFHIEYNDKKKKN